MIISYSLSLTCPYHVLHVLIMFHHKRLDIVPCAIQQDLMAYSLQMQ